MLVTLYMSSDTGEERFRRRPGVRRTTRTQIGKTLLVTTERKRPLA